MTKRNFEEYESMIANFDDEQLHKELWILDTHVHYLKKQYDAEYSHSDTDYSEILQMFKIAQKEFYRRKKF